MENQPISPETQPQPAAETPMAPPARPQAQVLEGKTRVLLPPDEPVQIRLEDYQRLLSAAGILDSDQHPHGYAERHTLRVGAYHVARQQAEQNKQPMPDGFADVEFMLTEQTAAEKYSPRNWAFVQAFGFYTYMNNRRAEVLAEQQKAADKDGTAATPKGPQLPNNRQGRKQAEKLAGKQTKPARKPVATTPNA
jgi:hypothetical protein